MEATDILMAEHRIIERVLKSLVVGAIKLEHGEAIRPVFFIDASDFIKGFADGCHHKKEEGVLFKAMIANGMPSDTGPIAVMLAEHERGRELTRAMRGSAQRLETGDAAAKEEVLKSARGYVALLSQHIAKEDGILFPLANSVIPVSQHSQLLDEFEKVEHEETGEGIHEKYLALAQALEKEAGSQ